MKKVLIPTDFSQTSNNAFSYAQSFLKDKASYCVLHAYQLPIDVNYPYPTQFSNTLIKTREEQLKSFASTQQSEGNLMVDINVHTQLEAGIASDVIVEKSKKDTDLIVMGRTGANSIIERVFGTVSVEVAQNAHCPVLLVPKEAEYRGILRVLYATNNAEASGEQMLENLLSLVGNHEPEVHFAQVKDDVFNYYELESSHYQKFFQKHQPNMKIRMVKFISNSAMEELHSYALDNHIDMIVVVTKHRNFIEQLFHRSMTKQLVLNSNIPLLVMHSNN